MLIPFAVFKPKLGNKATESILRSASDPEVFANLDPPRLKARQFGINLLELLESLLDLFVALARSAVASLTPSETLEMMHGSAKA